MLFTSNFSFSYSVFKRLVLQTSKNYGMFGKGLIDFKSVESIPKYKSGVRSVESLRKWKAIIAVELNDKFLDYITDYVNFY